MLEEGQAEPIKDTVLDEDGKPMIETRMLGVSDEACASVVNDIDHFTLFIR